MESNQGAQDAQAQDRGEQHRQVPGGGSGSGAASAYARMKSQREHQAWQQPAEDGSPGEGQGGSR